MYLFAIEPHMNGIPHWNDTDTLENKCLYVHYELNVSTIHKASKLLRSQSFLYFDVGGDYTNVYDYKNSPYCKTEFAHFLYMSNFNLENILK